MQKMRYGELHSRNWVNTQIESCPTLKSEEKRKLIDLNEDRKRQLFKYIMYHGPLTIINHLVSMAKLQDWPTVINFYFKALNFRRKSINKVHEPTRYHHTVIRQK